MWYPQESEEERTKREKILMEMLSKKANEPPDLFERQLRKRVPTAEEKKALKENWEKNREGMERPPGLQRFIMPILPGVKIY